MVATRLGERTIIVESLRLFRVTLGNLTIGFANRIAPFLLFRVGIGNGRNLLHKYVHKINKMCIL